MGVLAGCKVAIRDASDKGIDIFKELTVQMFYMVNVPCWSKTLIYTQENSTAHLNGLLSENKKTRQQLFQYPTKCVTLCDLKIPPTNPACLRKIRMNHNSWL